MERKILEIDKKRQTKCYKKGFYYKKFDKIKP